MEMEYQSYRSLWEKAHELDIIQAMPLHIDLEVNNDCNYNCIKCNRKQYKMRKEHMNIEFAKRIIKEFAEKGGYSIKFVFRGEPLLYGNLFSLIRYAKTIGVYDTWINTNGSLLSKDKIIDLVRSKLDHITFSIDTCNPKLYRKLQPPGNFDTIKMNLLTLIAYKQLLKVDKPTITIQRVEYPDETDQEPFEVYKDYWKSFDPSLIVLSQPFIKLYEEEEFFDMEGVCPELWRRLTIRVDGKVQFCCGTPTPDKIVGDLRKQTLEEIWNSECMNDYRELMKTGNISCIQACRFCNYFNGGFKWNPNVLKQRLSIPLRIGRSRSENHYPRRMYDGLMRLFTTTPRPFFRLRFKVISFINIHRA